MTTDDSVNRKEGTGRHPVPADDFFEDEVSIWPAVRALWGYRAVVMMGVAGIFLIFLLWAFTSYLTQPVERHASVGFRLEFEGAEDRRYPNGMVFSPADIVGAPILTVVFANHELERYSSFESFENHLFVLETNDALNMLGFEYQAKFAEEGVTPVDRANLEEEFLAKRAAQRGSAYSLSYLGPEGTVSIPDTLLNKVLNAVLSEWASQAIDRRGVLNYQGGVATANLLQDNPTDVRRGDEDFFVRVDVLRGKVKRLIASLEVIEELPGASVIKEEGNDTSLMDIRLNLAELLSYEIEPLSAYILANRMTGDWERTSSYLGDRRFQVSLDRIMAESKVRALEGSLRGYLVEETRYSSRGSQASNQDASRTDGGNAMLPSLRNNFGDPFLDRLISMAQDEVVRESAFEREVTYDIIEAREELALIDREAGYYSRPIEQEQTSLGGFGPEQLREAETRYQQTLDRVVQAAKDSVAIYEELSVQDLGPRTHLFTVTNPFASRTVRSISPGEMVPLGIFTLLIAFVVVLLCCVIHYYFQRERLA